MVINEKRLLENLYNLREFTDTPGNGVTRFSYSENDKKAREYITKLASDAGCNVSVDEIGNMRFALKTNEEGRKRIVCGSHIDSVKNGGWLDGIYGSISAIEVLLTLSENDYKGKYNYEAVVFAEEEGSNFGSTMTGSKFLTGQYKENDLDKLKDDSGKTLREYLNIDKLSENTVWDFENIKVMLELHIEQGPILDRENIGIGIVDAVFGMRVVEIEIEGVGNHAGATPMYERYDALCAASECILAAENIVSGDTDKRTVATIGKLNVIPDCSNVIPEKVVFSLEVRDKDMDKINLFMDKIIESSCDIAKRRKCKIKVTEHSKGAPIKLDDSIKNTMVEMAEKTGISYKKMDSGAVHDAAMIAEFVPTGMIFVPSIDGRSHVKYENTDTKDLISGAQFLMDVIEDMMK